MATEHKVQVYRGELTPMVGRHACVCGIFLPRVPFGIPLERAFAEHLKHEERKENGEWSLTIRETVKMGTRNVLLFD